MNEIKNLNASIRQQLLNKARKENRPFDDVLRYYANERFLCRLSQSRYADLFILKGAFVLFGLELVLPRPTRDLDFLALTKNEINNITKIFREVCTQQVQEDGLRFDENSIRANITQTDRTYGGINIQLNAFLGKSRIPMSFDIGFGDQVTPKPLMLKFPPVLSSFDSVSIRSYPPETIIAEKFQILVDLGIINSRLKDYFDVWFLSISHSFNYIILQNAIQTTFSQRKTTLPSDFPSGLSLDFASNHREQWTLFCNSLPYK